MAPCYRRRLDIPGQKLDLMSHLEAHQRPSEQRGRGPKVERCPVQPVPGRSIINRKFLGLAASIVPATSCTPQITGKSRRPRPSAGHAKITPRTSTKRRFSRHTFVAISSLRPQPVAELISGHLLPSFDGLWNPTCRPSGLQRGQESISGRHLDIHGPDCRREICRWHLRMGSRDPGGAMHAGESRHPKFCTMVRPAVAESHVRT
jgi:hypothetical protein